MDLNKKKCVPCEGGVPTLNLEESNHFLKQIDSKWELKENHKICREFAFVNYKHTMNFVNQVAQLSEEEGHHPVMHVNYGKVDIEIWTHAINGLSENDFILASKIDLL